MMRWMNRMLALTVCCAILLSCVGLAFSEEISQESPALLEEITGIEATEAPTEQPTEAPATDPTEATAVDPTETPTVEPTATPTVEPTETPTPEPTATPTVEPTIIPTAEPIAEPTVPSTEVPTATEEPTEIPTPEPTQEPTAEEPVTEPTVAPTEEPPADPVAEDPETETPEVEVPETEEPVTETPEEESPEAEEPETEIPEEEIHEPEEPETETPEEEIPETEEPETETPEIEVPEAEEPETETPEEEIPETEEPETETPEEEIPETEEPETETPEEEIPETEEPETETPEVEVPEAEEPETETPEKEIPETEEPEPETPEEGTPAEEPESEPEATRTVTEVSAPESLESETESLDDTAGSDNDELFAHYFERALNPDGLESAGPAAMRKINGEKLTDANYAIYLSLKADIAEVAAGNRASTQFSVSFADAGIPTAWTLEELGITDTSQVKDAIKAKLGEYYNAKQIVRTLMTDCPYEMYWFDKATGYSYGGYGYQIVTYSDGTQEIDLTGDLRFGLTVAQGYSQSGTQATYEMNTQVGQAVQSTVTTAEGIVSRYAESTDLQKLAAYRDEICGMVSYNYDAAGQTNPVYGDPWQVIYVFDQDENTNVVCEGYSKAFQYLCDLSNFDEDVSCYTVTGAMSGATGSGLHMWNIVTMDDGYNYLADITNSDDGTVGSGGSLFLNGYDSGDVATGYNYSTVTYTYDSDISLIYNTDELTLSGTRYSSTAHCDLEPTHKLVKVAAAAATCQDDGNIAYWLCQDCGRMFTTRAGKVELSASEVIIPASPALHALTAHPAQEPTAAQPGSIAYWSCSACGKLFADSTGTQEISLEDTVLPMLTPSPTPEPTATATPEPSVTATPEPTAKPTPAPTVKPTPASTAKPTPAPTAKPTPAPTEKPTPTAKPTPTPTAKPTPTPTAKPTPAPTAKPTPAPTAKPTQAPTARPTATLTAKPTSTPTVVPTFTPSPTPTTAPTATPTIEPTAEPTPTPIPAPIKISKCKIRTSNKTYTGKARKPAVHVEYKGVKLVKGVDFTLKYKNNVKIGTASVTVKGIGRFTGSVKATFKIIPKGTTLSKLTGGKKKFTVTWKKQTKQVSGYQIQYATKKNFSNAKKVTVSGAKSVKTTVRNLKAKKYYYVRVRTYKKVGGKKYYSAWSVAKRIKTK